MNEVPAEVAWLDKLLPAVIQTSIFGGSITFSVIVSVPKEESKRDRIIHDLSIAFLIFALGLFIASGAELVLCFNRTTIIGMIEGSMVVAMLVALVAMKIKADASDG
jgi:hypothetical protein